MILGVNLDCNEKSFMVINRIDVVVEGYRR